MILPAMNDRPDPTPEQHEPDLRHQSEGQQPDIPKLGSQPPEVPSAESFYDLFGSGTLLLLFTGCLLLYLLLQGMLWGGKPGAPVWGLAAAPVLGILLPLAVLIRSLHRSVRVELWLFPLSARQLAGVVLAILGTVPVAYALASLNLELVAPDPESEQLLQNLVPTDLSSFFAGLFAVVLLAPLGEEVLFRALLLGTLGRHLGGVVAVLVVAVLFGMTHFAPWVILPLTALGFVLGMLVLLTRALTAAWVGHALFNLIGYLELALTGDARTTALTQWLLQPPALVAAPMLLAAAYWLLRSAGKIDAGTV